MEVTMNVNIQSTKHAKWTTKLWRTLAAWEGAISVSPMEHLERRIAVLEQKVGAGKAGTVTDADMCNLKE
jgi:hypothetical protein